MENKANAGTPQRFCQCCGMPLGDSSLYSKEPDGTVNTDYCKWCYADGAFTYTDKDTLLDFLLGHMPNPQNMPDDVRRMQYDAFLSELKHWKTSQQQ